MHRTSLPRRATMLSALGAAIVGWPQHAARPQTRTAIRGQARLTLRLGLLTEASDPDIVTAATMATEDFGGTVDGRPIELLQADHRNDSDRAIDLARHWYDQGITAIFAAGPPRIARSLQGLTGERDRVQILLSTASTDLTGDLCSPNTIHWTSDSHAQALGPVRYFTGVGARLWFFLTADDTDARRVQRDTTAMIEAAGGRVIGAAPLGPTPPDRAAAWLRAQRSQAHVIALATPGPPEAQLIRQADTQGLRRQGRYLAPLSLTLDAVKALGLPAAQGLIETAPYYWNHTAAMRDFAERHDTRAGRMPNTLQASAWGAVTHYLKSVKATGSDAAPAVLAHMKATPIQDFMTRNGIIRADGRVMRDMLLLRAKPQAASTSPWDLEQVLTTIPAAEAFPLPTPATCQLIRP